MPIKIPDQLPARQTLTDENIFVMDETRAIHQDIRPLKIMLLNLMPTKIATETQFLRLLGNTPLQVETTLVRMRSHQSKNTSQEHLLNFYQTFSEVKRERFDGMIITGAPVEQMPFEQVDYWDELVEIMDWGLSHVFAHLYVCWGAQAALYHQYGIQKIELPAKVFGVYEHTVLVKNSRLLRGFDDRFYVPHSRHTEVSREDVLRAPDLRVLSESEEAGIYIIASRDSRRVYLTGHSEYDPLTLKNEYDRDLTAGLPIAVPVNYFPADDPNQPPLVRWRSHAHLLFANWINYYVYQETPCDLNRLNEFHASQRQKAEPALQPVELRAAAPSNGRHH